MLTGIMGGELTVRSEVGRGSAFAVKLLLSEVTDPRPPAAEARRVKGYAGPRRTVMVVDDDPVHRDLMVELLEPLGFIVMSAPDGPSCLALVEHCRPDLFLLDVSMPGLDGWTLAERLRRGGHRDARALMLSANAIEVHRNAVAEPFHDRFLIKPVDLGALLDAVQRLLGFGWILEEPEGSSMPRPAPGPAALPPREIADLRALGELGLLRGIGFKLDEIALCGPASAAAVARLRGFAALCDLPRFMAELDTLAGKLGADA